MNKKTKILLLVTLVLSILIIISGVSILSILLKTTLRIIPTLCFVISVLLLLVINKYYGLKKLLEETKELWKKIEM